MAEDDEQRDDDEGAIGVRTDFDPEEPIGEADDEAVFEVVLKPTRTAGDLSELADDSPGYTMEDYERDLEPVVPKPPVPTQRELLVELLRRVRRIEEHLGIATTGPFDECLDSP
jgi:hypothetical protein